MGGPPDSARLRRRRSRCRRGRLRQGPAAGSRAAAARLPAEAGAGQAKLRRRHAPGQRHLLALRGCLLRHGRLRLPGRRVGGQGAQVHRRLLRSRQRAALHVAQGPGLPEIRGVCSASGVRVAGSGGPGHLRSRLPGAELCGRRLHSFYANDRLLPSSSCRHSTYIHRQSTVPPPHLVVHLISRSSRLLSALLTARRSSLRKREMEVRIRDTR